MADDVIVVEGSRFKIAIALIFLVGMAALLAFGAWAIVADFHLSPPSPHPSRYALLRTYVMPYLASGLGLFCAYSAFRGAPEWKTPPRLEIGPTGFTRFARGKAERWRWDQAENFRLTSDGQLTSVQFDDYRPPSGTEDRPLKPRTTVILGAYALGGRGLLRLMTESRARWAAPPLAQDPAKA